MATTEQKKRLLKAKIAVALQNVLGSAKSSRDRPSVSADKGEFKAVLGQT